MELAGRVHVLGGRLGRRRCDLLVIISSVVLSFFQRGVSDSSSLDLGLRPQTQEHRNLASRDQWCVMGDSDREKESE